MDPRSKIKKNKKEKFKDFTDKAKQKFKKVVENNKKPYPPAINTYAQQDTSSELNEEEFELLLDPPIDPPNLQVPAHYLQYATQQLQSSNSMMTANIFLPRENELQQQMEKAIDTGDVSLLNQLIETAKEKEKEANLDYQSLLIKSLWVKSKAFFLAKTIIEKAENDLIASLAPKDLVRLIYFAASEGDLEFMKSCAEYVPANLDINIHFVLVCAATNGHDNVVKYFLHRGVSPDVEIDESYMGEMCAWLRGENPDDAANQPSNGKSILSRVYDWAVGANQDDTSYESPKSKSIYEYVKEKQNENNAKCVTLLSYGTKKYVETFLKTIIVTAIQGGKCNASKIQEMLAGSKEAGAWQILNQAYLLQRALREKSHAFLLAKAIIEHTKTNDDTESFCIKGLKDEDFVKLVYLAGSEGDLIFMQDCLKYLDQGNYHSAAINFTCLQAAINGQEEVVQYLLSLQSTLPDIEIKENGLPTFQAWVRDEKTEDTSNEASNAKSLLKWVIESRNPKNAGCIKLLTACSQNSINEFFDAISGGDVGKVNQSLIDGVSTKVQSSDYMTPLGMAVKNGKADIVKILLEKGGDPDETTYLYNNGSYSETTPFWIAYNNNDSACLKLMIPKSKAAEKVMIDGIKTGYQELVGFLLPYGFAELVDEKELLKIALECHSKAITEGGNHLKTNIEEVIKQLLPYSKATKEKMFSEAQEGKSETIEKFLGFGFDINITNESGQTLLQVAAQHGHANVVKVMLAAGSDPDTALTLARNANHHECVKLLAAVSEHAKNELYAAASGGETATIEKLLDEGAEPYAVMSRALANKNLACAQALLNFEFDVDKRLQDSGNLSALDVAMRENDDDCLKLMIPKSKECVRQLYKAVEENRQSDACKLLEYGVKPDTKLEDQECSAFELARKNNNKGCIVLLTSYSSQAVYELFSAASANNFEKVKQLLTEGVDRNAVMLKALKQKNAPCVKALLECGQSEFDPDLPLDDEKSARQIVLDEGDEEFIKLITGEHPLIANLDNEINELRKTEGNKEARDAFVTSLEIMRDNLRRQINKQHPNFNEQCRAAKIAKYTVDMLANLRKPKGATMDAGAYQDARLEIIKDYENNCKKTYRRSTGLKILAMVVFGAVGFVAGAVIGMAIGMALGAWSGPGAFVTAALGGLTGGAAGAVIGVLAAAGATAAGSFALSGVVMFKPRGLRKEIKESVSLGKKYVCSGS